MKKVFFLHGVSLLILSILLCTVAFAQDVSGEFVFMDVPIKIDRCLYPPKVEEDRVTIFAADSELFLSMNDVDGNLETFGVSLEEYKNYLFERFGDEAFTSACGIKTSIRSLASESTMTMYYIATMDFGKDTLVGVELTNYIPQLNIVNETPLLPEVISQLAEGLADRSVESLRMLEKEYIPQKLEQNVPVIDIKEWGVEFCGLVPSDRRVKPNEVLQSISNVMGVKFEQQYSEELYTAYSASFEIQNEIPHYLAPWGVCSVEISVDANGVSWWAEIGIVPSEKDTRSSYYTAQDAWNVFEPLHNDLISSFGEAEMYFVALDNGTNAYEISKEELLPAWIMVQNAENGWIEMCYENFSLVAEKMVVGENISNNCWLKFYGE